MICRPLPAVRSLRTPFRTSKRGIPGLHPQHVCLRNTCLRIPPIPRRVLLLRCKRQQLQEEHWLQVCRMTHMSQALGQPFLRESISSSPCSSAGYMWGLSSS